MKGSTPRHFDIVELSIPPILPYRADQGPAVNTASLWTMLKNVVGRNGGRNRFSPGEDFAVQVVIEPDCRRPAVTFRRAGVASEAGRSTDPVASFSPHFGRGRGEDGCHPVSPNPSVPLDLLCDRLKGKSLALNHAGMSFPPSSLAKGERYALARLLAETGAAFAHPGEPDWIFLVSRPLRNGGNPHLPTPMFEIVFETSDKTVPTVQFDIQTDLSPAEADELFPSPTGFVSPVTDRFFRSVFIETSWNCALLRIDLRFASHGGAASFSEWLLAEGARLHDGDLERFR